MNSNIKPAAAAVGCTRRRRSHISRQMNTKTAMVAVYTTTGALCLGILFSCAVAFSPVQTNNNNPVQSRAFIQDNNNNIMNNRLSTYLFSKNDLFPKDEFDKDDFLDEDDDEFDSSKYDPAVAAQIRKAKKLISDAKKTQKANEEAAAKAAKAAADGDEADESTLEKEEKAPKTPLPFFASKSSTPDAKKIKSKTKSGEIIADGEEMASLSKSEPWERRSLSQMFERESRTDYDGNLVEGEQIDPKKVLADRDMAASIYGLRKKLQNDDFMKVFDKRNRFIGDVD